MVTREQHCCWTVLFLRGVVDIVTPFNLPTPYLKRWVAHAGNPSTALLCIVETDQHISHLHPYSWKHHEPAKKVSFRPANPEKQFVVVEQLYTLWLTPSRRGDRYFETRRPSVLLAEKWCEDAAENEWWLSIQRKYLSVHPRSQVGFSTKHTTLGVMNFSNLCEWSFGIRYFYPPA